MTPTTLSQFPFWYHRITLPDGTITPGGNPINEAAYRLPENLHGERILDVGAWDGYWTFEALRRGASSVTAIDDFSDHLGPLIDSAERRAAAWRTFDFAREQFGYPPDRCSRIEMSLYDISPSTLGTFDRVLFFGVLYHCRHPLLALDRIASVSTGTLHVETAIADDFSPYRQGGFGQGYPGRQMIMEFYPAAQYGNNPTNWWAPTLQCLGAMLTSAGFKNIALWKLTNEPRQLEHCRGFASAVKR